MTVTQNSTLLATPGLVDAHIHPDKSAWGAPWMSRKLAANLAELIANDRDSQFDFTMSVEDRVTGLFEQAVANGTLALRAHVDVSPELGTTHVEGVRAAAERLAPFLTVQIVAFPQFGLLTNPGTLDVMAASLDAGADIVGGIDPVGVEGDMHGHLDAVFGLADSKGRDLDIHLHDGGETGLEQIREIAARTIATGRQGRVTIGHAFALCDESLPSLGQTLDLVAEAGVWIATCGLGADPVPNLAQLQQHGVRVVAGSDGVRDTWSPFGTASMVDRAHLIAYRTGALTDADLEHVLSLATKAGGELLGVPEIANWAGPESDTRLEFAAENLAQLVVDRPAPLRVIRNGREFTRG
ncbi:amidohydrolase family protein [Leucobacter viscericola]|uniref:Amidohydrolase family protein n=1 Tax=Leucobacter viscericola TaxID=2714935 RepID=A0A6G7XFU6_9MICO|nr:amidohydrolase family protein [Leucobacter viscericola]QIK63267.1 amidohydrolase family protein [Leucobacter viscericola]